MHITYSDDFHKLSRELKKMDLLNIEVYYTYINGSVVV